MADWRFIAQRAATGEFLHWELPLTIDDGPVWDLSGAGSLKAHVSPQIGSMVADDGDLLFLENGTYIFALKDDDVQWGGILLHSQLQGATWGIEAAGFSSYAHGNLYVGQYTQLEVDPLTAFRHIWSYLNSRATNLNLDVVGDTDSGVTLGEPALPAYDQVFLDGTWQNVSDVDPDDIDPRRVGTLYAKITAGATSLRLKTLSGFDTLSSFPYNIKVGAEVLTVSSRTGTTLHISARGVLSTPVTAHYTGTRVTYDGTPRRTVLAVDAEPYLLATWENQDCGDELDNLVETTPFEWRETHAWVGAVGGSITHEIEVAAPLLAETRDDLAFVQGENVINVVEVDRDGDEWASEVYYLGAGEGNKALRAHATGDPGSRLPRTRLTPAKGITHVSQLQTLANRELAARSDVEQLIESITVREHPNAPIGSWNVGDNITVRANLPWLGDVAIACRIISWKLDSSTQATLTLVRNTSSPQSRLARVIDELSKRLDSVERRTQLKYSSITYPGTETFPGSGVYNPPTDFNLKDRPFSDFTFDDQPLDTSTTSALEGLDSLESRLDDGEWGGIGGGGSGGSMVAVYETSPGVWPARPDATTVVWVGTPGGIGPTPPAGEGELEGEGGAQAGDIWLEVFE